MNNKELIDKIADNLYKSIYRQVYNRIYKNIKQEFNDKLEEEKIKILKTFQCFNQIDIDEGIDLSLKENQFFNYHTKFQFRGNKIIKDFKKHSEKWKGQENSNQYATEKQFNLENRRIISSERYNYIKASVPVKTKGWQFVQQKYYNYCQTIEGHRAEERKKIGKKLRFEVLKKYNYQCVYCGTKGTIDNPLEIDHIIPVIQGGKNEINNLVCACRNCNRGKSDKRL